jgi:hypothetical protein
VGELDLPESIIVTVPGGFSFFFPNGKSVVCRFFFSLSLSLSFSVEESPPAADASTLLSTPEAISRGLCSPVYMERVATRGSRERGKERVSESKSGRERGKESYSRNQNRA